MFVCCWHALPFQILPAAELQDILEEHVEWHDKNISNFVEKWKAYVEPNRPGAAAKVARPSLDNKLPD